jgi:glutathione S-transferase
MLTFYSAWFCPYAHRAWLGLLQRGVAFERIESLSHPHGPDKPYAKHEGLLRANPRGLVPTLVDDATGHVCVESLLCLQLIAELPSPDGGSDRCLMPSDPYDRADARQMAQWIDENVCSPYYGCLVPNADNSPDDWQERRASSFEKLRSGLVRFGARLEQHGCSPGRPFYLGSAHPTVVDFALAPWAWRFPVLETYRGEAFALRRDDDALAPYWAWKDALMSLDAMRSTLEVVAEEGGAVHGAGSAMDVYTRHVKKYSDGVAKSLVADAVRAGRTAHDLG